MGAWGCSPPPPAPAPCPAQPVAGGQWDQHQHESCSLGAPKLAPQVLPRKWGPPGGGKTGALTPHRPWRVLSPPRTGWCSLYPMLRAKFPSLPQELGLLWGMGKGEAEQSCALHPSALATSSWGGSLNTAGAVPPPHPELWGCLGPRHPPPQTPKLPRAAWGLPGAQLKGGPSRVPLTPHSCSTSSIKGETGGGGVKELPPAPGPPRIPLPWAPAPGGPSRASTTKRSSAQLPSRAMAPPRRGQLPRLYNPGPPPWAQGPPQQRCSGMEGGEAKAMCKAPGKAGEGGSAGSSPPCPSSPGPRSAGIPKIRCGARSRAPLVRGRGGKR